MLVINFAHPFTQPQRQQIESLADGPIAEVIDVACQFDHQRPFPPQIISLLDAIPLTPTDWQTRPILINPPAYAPAAASLMAELHGRMGYFPAILRLRPVLGSTPPQFEAAELINLQAVRDAAREGR